MKLRERDRYRRLCGPKSLEISDHFSLFDTLRDDSAKSRAKTPNLSESIRMIVFDHKLS